MQLKSHFINTCKHMNHFGIKLLLTWLPWFPALGFNAEAGLRHYISFVRKVKHKAHWGVFTVFSQLDPQTVCPRAEFSVDRLAFEVIGQPENGPILTS